MGRGLIVELELQLSSFSFKLSIDYQNVPYRCMNCHNTRHLISTCTKKYVQRKDFRCHEPPRTLNVEYQLAPSSIFPSVCHEDRGNSDPFSNNSKYLFSTYRNENPCLVSDFISFTGLDGHLDGLQSKLCLHDPISPPIQSVAHDSKNPYCWVMGDYFRQYGYNKSDNYSAEMLDKISCLEMEVAFSASPKGLLQNQITDKIRLQY